MHVFFFFYLLTEVESKQDPETRAQVMLTLRAFLIYPGKCFCFNIDYKSFY